MKAHRLISQKVLFDHFFEIQSLEFEKEGEQTPLTRYVVVRPTATAILLHNRNKDTLVMVRQFRAPVYAQERDPFLLEFPAGVVEKGELPMEAIIRETREETGYCIDKAALVTACYTSPGVFSEKIYIYFAEVEDEDQMHDGGGVESEREDVEIVELPVEEVFKKAGNGEIMDAKTLAGLYWYRSYNR